MRRRKIEDILKKKKTPPCFFNFLRIFALKFCPLFPHKKTSQRVSELKKNGATIENTLYSRCILFLSLLRTVVVRVCCFYNVAVVFLVVSFDERVLMRELHWFF